MVNEGRSSTAVRTDPQLSRSGQLLMSEWVPGTLAHQLTKVDNDAFFTCLSQGSCRRSSLQARTAVQWLQSIGLSTAFCRPSHLLMS